MYRINHLSFQAITILNKSFLIRQDTRERALAFFKNSHKSPLKLESKYRFFNGNSISVTNQHPQFKGTDLSPLVILWDLIPYHNSRGRFFFS